MEQSPRTSRSRALSVQIPQTYTAYAARSPPTMSSYRALSPGGRRIQHNPARASDSLMDPYGQRQTYISPRTSTSGVIPLSSETYVTEQPQSAREPPRGGVYSGQYAGRPRRSSLLDSQRGSAVSQVPSRSRPTIVQDTGRPSSPLKGSREKDYYVTPAVSKEPRKVEHKKIYSVNTDGDAKLVADIDTTAGRERHHRRRESVERGGYLTTGNERERGRRDYHPSSRTATTTRDASVDDKDAYSYTDAATMYATTEPKWRPEGPRPRRGSVDRGASRDRPVSMLVEPSYDPRASAKDLGPPPSTRGWEALNRVGRTTSVRDGPPRTVAQSPNRSRFVEPMPPYVDPYYVPPRTSSREGRSHATHNDRPGERYAEHEHERETRRERRHSVTRRPDESLTRRPDPNIPIRGFGLRSESKDRFARDVRGSDENIKDRQVYRDSGLGYVEPHRRDTAPDISYHEERRLEQEKRDREAARLQAEERDRQYERDRERDRKREEDRKRDEERGYDRDYDRERKERDRAAERETERERERQRMMERDPERDRDRQREKEREPEREKDRDRHRERRDPDRDRDRERNRGDRDRDDRKENGDRTPSLAQAATGGLAGAAAAFGLNRVFNKDKGDDREKDKDRERDRDRDSDRERKRERERDPDRDDDRKRPEEPSRKDERDRKERRPEASLSDGSGAPFDREPPRDDRHRDVDRGLGFAFERPIEPPKQALPIERPREREREPQRAQDWQERDLEREHEDKHADMSQAPVLDAEEDYRRRMEQVQRELGRAPPVDDRGSSDSDPDRERRRREREQRQREKEDRDYPEPKLNAGVGLTALNEQPPPPELRRSFEDAPSEVTASSASGQPGQALRRKRSILDEPMTSEPVQIIDNSYSDKRENRVRIVDPPTEEEERKPKGILKKPTKVFPDHPDTIREGVAPLKDATSKGIPPGARWTKIDRRLVNPQALEEAKERFEERLDCVIVLRVLTKEDIQKLADRTSALRDERYEEERQERKAAKRRERNSARHENDEYIDDSEDEWAEKKPKMLEAPAPQSVAGASYAASSGVNSGDTDFVRDNRERRRDRDEREPQYMSGGLGRRE
ncbi:hypothetical protein LTR17_003520 [Elasticomyces elasticus]|nr:hypothetical protein LTR17_003520 [Elasticomyces elasticus]